MSILRNLITLVLIFCSGSLIYITNAFFEYLPTFYSISDWIPIEYDYEEYFSFPAVVPQIGIPMGILIFTQVISENKIKWVFGFCGLVVLMYIIFKNQTGIEFGLFTTYGVCDKSGRCGDQEITEFDWEKFNTFIVEPFILTVSIFFGYVLGKFFSYKLVILN